MTRTGCPRCDRTAPLGSTARAAVDLHRAVHDLVRQLAELLVPGLLRLTRGYLRMRYRVARWVRHAH